MRLVSEISMTENSICNTSEKKDAQEHNNESHTHETALRTEHALFVTQLASQVSQLIR